MTKLLTEHAFTVAIRQILIRAFGEDADTIFAASPLLGYLNVKTRAANRGSKSRSAFANHYALYVIIEDYVKKGFSECPPKKSYTRYEGAKFSDLFRRQRELPFGTKLQNHALNSRLNEEFRKFYPTLKIVPIVRDVEKQRYWIQEDLLHITIRKKDGSDYCYNIAKVVLEIIDTYIAVRRKALDHFLHTCQQIENLCKKDVTQTTDFVLQQLRPKVDARIFEIVSFAILKSKYGEQSIWMGKTRDSVTKEMLVLYKTGRTNANDGGIDFVMRPIRRFFQVTETISADKYFLDIDKVLRFPLTFVVKSTNTKEFILENIRKQTFEKYRVDTIVQSYMEAIEEVINVPDLECIFHEMVQKNRLAYFMRFSYKAN